MDTKQVLSWLGNSVHDIAGTVATAAGAIAVMDPALVQATLGPKAAAWALLVGGVIQLSKAQQVRMSAKSQPAQSVPPTEESKP